MKLGRKVIAVLAMLFVCVGFVRGANAAEVKVAEQLIVLTGADASTFDPHMCTDSATEIFNRISITIWCVSTTRWRLSQTLPRNGPSPRTDAPGPSIENRREIPRRD